MSELVQATDGTDQPLLPLAVGLGAFVFNLGLVLYVRGEFELSQGLIALCGLVVAAQCFGSAAGGRLVGPPLWRALAQLAWFWLIMIAVIVLQWISGLLLVLLIAVAGGSVLLLWRRARRPDPRVRAGLPLALVVMAIGLVGVAGYQHAELQTHFLAPEFLDLGILHKDPMGFASFVGLIANAKVPGGALDGVQPFAYHFGTFYFVAALTQITGQAPVPCLIAAHQLIFIPLMLYHLAAAVSGRRPEVSATHSGLAVPLALGLFFLLAGATWPIVFYSESTAAAMPLLFLFVQFARAWTTGDSPLRTQLTTLLFLCPLLLLSLLVKITTGFLLVAFAGYLAMLIGTVLRRSVVVGVYLLVCAAVVLGAAVFSWVPLQEALRAGALREIPNLPVVIGEAESALLTLVALIAVGLPSLNRIRPLSGLAKKLDSLTVGYLLWFAAAIAGTCVIAAVQLLYNGRYLFNTLLLATIPLLAVGPDRLIGHRLSKRWVVWLAPPLLLIVFVSLLEQTRLRPSDAPEKIESAIESMCQAIDAECRSRFGLLSIELPAVLGERMGTATGARLLRQADRLRTAGAEGFFVPADADPVWRFLLSGSSPQANLLLLPAKFGLPMVLGLPPARYGLDLPTINASHPGSWVEADRSRPMDDAALCRHAESHGIRAVGIIGAIDTSEAIRLLSCEKVAPRG